jgi:sterol desaturase/sphingolipid hydroxylase (fatty acid hydroxylase superfamily)
VEPLYYAVHRWLHVPEQFKKMHGFHHSSVNTVPSTSLVQNFQEHFVYVATFGPAMLLPYFLNGANHWIVTAGYLLLFDIVNAFGHTNIVIRHWLFDSKWSPLRYLFYTPEFHLGHHAYYNYNFGLFMPLWDHLFHTYREYRRPDAPLEPADKQDFVFIGHNGGLGHFLTIPEVGCCPSCV